MLHLALDWLQELPAGKKKGRNHTEYPDRILLANQTCYLSAINSNPHFSSYETAAIAAVP